MSVVPRQLRRLRHIPRSVLPSWGEGKNREGMGEVKRKEGCVKKMKRWVEKARGV